MAEYLSDNPRFIVNDFLWSGITGALDGDNEADDDSMDNNGLIMTCWMTMRQTLM